MGTTQKLWLGLATPATYACMRGKARMHHPLGWLA